MKWNNPDNFPFFSLNISIDPLPLHFNNATIGLNE